MPPIPTPGTKPAGAGGGRLTAWLRTREGKITAGAGAALVVVVLALARGRGSGAAPFVAESLQTGPDATLQDRLDQLGLRGGTLEELIGSTSDLTRGVTDLTERLDDLKPGTTTPATPAPKTLAQLTKDLDYYKGTYRRLLDLRATHLANPPGQRNRVRIDQLTRQAQRTLTSQYAVQEAIAKLQGATG